MPSMMAAPAVVASAFPSSAAEATVQYDDNSLSSIVDARNAYGSTALHRAAFNGREGVVLALLKCGADVGVVGKSGR